MVDFFIRRPIFATVCALLIILAGAVSIPTLPISLYPALAPPQVTVTSNYVGANANVVESAVTIPLEQQINGVEGMHYITSVSSNDGTSNINVVFRTGYDLNIAAVDVQNRVATAQGRLPQEIKNTGVTITKANPNFVFAAGFFSPDNSLSNQYISNYLDVYVKDALKRIPGVGDVRIFGERKYAMRLWLDPTKLAARQLTAADVVSALQEQNVQIPAGQLGRPPADPKQSFQIALRVVGRLSDPKEFESIILKNTSNGIVQLKDVGRAEIGAESYDTNLMYSGHDAVGVGVQQLSNANALDVDKAAKAALAELSKSFPPGMKYVIAFDTTTVVGDSVKEVVTTLEEAIIIVIIVIFLFLLDWRATIIPAVTIPVSLIGTFAAMQAFPAHIASKNTNPNPSPRLGMTKNAQSLYKPRKHSSVTFPKNSTASPKPRATALERRRGRSVPSPTTTRRALGCSDFSRGQISNIKSWPLYLSCASIRPTINAKRLGLRSGFTARGSDSLPG